MHGPVTVKYCALVKPTIRIRKTMRGRPGVQYLVRCIFGGRGRGDGVSKKPKDKTHDEDLRRT